MKKDFNQLFKILANCNKKEQELSFLKKKLLVKILPFLNFYDFNEEHINLDEYLQSLSVEYQGGDGFVIVDEMSRNIKVIWLITFIEDNDKINYSQFLNYSI